MARTKAQRAEPPHTIALPALDPFVGAALEVRGDYEALAFVDRDFADQVADDVAFLGCRMERCGLDEVSMRRARFAECLIADSHAVSIELRDCSCRDSLVSGGRFGALNAPGATWTNVRVRGGKLDFVDFGGARLTDVTFEGCVIGELDLADAQVRSVAFPGTTVEALTITGAKLTQVDLTGATLRVVRGIPNLRGAIVSPEQLVDLAPLLAAHVGLEIRGD